jgi:hypothetical protein
MTNVRFLDSFIAETGKNEFPVLTVRQPYASMLISGHKTKEFRNWRIPVHYIDEWVLIHAGTRQKGRLFVDRIEYEDFLLEYRTELPEHAIIGAVKFSEAEKKTIVTLPIVGSIGAVKVSAAEKTDCVKYIYAWPVTDRVQFIPEIPDIKGKLRFWKYKIDLPTHIKQQIN